MVTGNPGAGEVLAAERESSRKELGLDDRPLVLSFGGSLGRPRPNRAAAYMLAQSGKKKAYQHIHGYGPNDEKFLDEVKEMGFLHVSRAPDQPAGVHQQHAPVPVCSGSGNRPGGRHDLSGD